MSCQLLLGPEILPELGASDCPANVDDVMVGGTVHLGVGQVGV